MSLLKRCIASMIDRPPWHGSKLILQSELEELDKMEPSSAACKEVLASMEGIPDALLPITKGPENSAWERWFQPVRSSRKWWKNKDSDFS